jgi:hypothetical protein
MEITSGDLTPRATRPLRRRLVRTSLGVGPARPDADASDERIIELWLRDRPANKKMASGLLFATIVYSVTLPPIVIRPILLALISVNQIAPSGPAAI